MAVIKKPVENIYPELPGVSIEPTNEELREAGELIAKGYLDPSKCKKFEPKVLVEDKSFTVEQAIKEGRIGADDPLVPKDADGMILYYDPETKEKTVINIPIPVREGKGFKFEIGDDGHPVWEEGPDVDFGSQQDRIIYAVQHLTCADKARKNDLARVYHKFQSVDKGLKKESMLLAERIDKILSSEDGEISESELIAEIEKTPTHVPVADFLQRHMVSRTKNPDVTFVEFSAMFEEARLSSRLARVVGEVASEMNKLPTIAEKIEFLDKIESAMAMMGI